MIRKSIVALIVVGIICSLAIAGFVALQKFFLPQFLRTKIVEIFSQCVRGEVTVGEVDFNPFRGITINELNIGDPTTGNNQPLIKVSAISVEYSPFYFLFGKILIKGITLASPEIFVERTEAGKWNISELIRPDFKWPFLPVEGSFKNGIVIKDVWVNLRDASLPEEFINPRPISGIQVFLSPSPEGITVFNISGDFDDGFWGNCSFGGKLNLEEGKFNLDVLARNISLCEELIKRIPSVGARLWDNVAPSGRVALTSTIKYDKKLYYDFIVDVKDGTFEIKEFPLPVHGLTGTVELCNGRLYLRNLSGNVGDIREGQEQVSVISLNGEICLDGSDGILRVDVSNLNGNEGLVRMIPEVGDKIWTDYKPTGRADVNATCIAKDGKIKLDNLTINVRDASAVYVRLPLPVSSITGALELYGGNLFIKKLHGRLVDGQSASLDLQGRINLKGTDGVLNINISNLNVTEKIVKAIPSFGQRIWSEYMPEGRCDLAVTCNVKDRKVNCDAIADLRDMKFLCDRWPFPIIGTNGKIEYSGNTLYFRGVNGYMVPGTLTNDKKLATAHFNLDGLVDITAPSCSLRLEMANLVIGEPLVRKLPGIGDKLWETLRPRGRMDVRMEYKIGSKEREPEFYTEINCKEVGILYAKLPVPVSNLNGFVETDGNTVRARELNGSVCNGDISAVLGLDLGSTPVQYKLKLNFVDADLGEFVKVAFKSDKQLSGFISGQSEFYCNGNGTENTSGKGEINLHEGDIFEMPVILSLFKVLNLSLPDKDTFHSANVGYTIERGIVHIEKARLISDTVEISGTGNIGLDGKLDMMAIVEFRGNSFLDGIPIVGEVKDFLIGGITRRLTKFEIKGTVTDPQTRSVSFKALKHPSFKNVFELLKSE